MHLFNEDLTSDDLKHFGLSEQPFDFLDQYDRIWMSPSMRTALAEIKRAIKRHRIFLLAGEVGSGKTSILRHLVAGLMKDSSNRLIWPDILDKKRLTGNHIVEMVLRDLGKTELPRSAARRMAMIRTDLEAAVSGGVNPILIIDEAHDLTGPVFVALKRLWDSGVLFRLLTILVVGQGGHDENGRPFGVVEELQVNPAVREFAERCQLVDLGRLNGNFASYIDYRLKEVGSSAAQVFEPGALAALAKRVRTPLSANILAVRAMKECKKDGKKLVSADHVNAA